MPQTIKTIIAAVTVSETGSVTNLLFSNEHSGDTWRPLTTYGYPYLGAAASSEEWRSMLGRQITEDAEAYFGLSGLHGERLAYVSPSCTLYVFEVDFEAYTPKRAGFDNPQHQPV